MASKENQIALNNLVIFADPFDQDEFNRVKKWNETLQKAIDRLETLEEKQIPKQPNLEGDGYADGYMVYDTAICPNCGERICEDGEDDINWGNDYCHKCGQRLSWEFENETDFEAD